MHGGNIEDSHTSTMCRKLGSTHNPHATLTNTMGGSAAGMHKTILPLASGRTAPNCCPQQQKLPQQRLHITHYPAQSTAWQQAPPPAHFGEMSLAGGSYHQRITMVNPDYQRPGQVMMNFVSQYPLRTGTAQMMQLPQQQVMPMIAPYHPNQQPYYAPNQQPLGYF
jgi:hypothetical protein